MERKNPDSQATSDNIDPWASLHTTIGQLDKHKVKDCKEDVDTLLVFAGLYSAVLTAFLIESYRNLQEDPQQTMIQLLRQISSQTSSYEITTKTLNSTVSPLSTPLPFHVSAADIRVNVCWFASLILSLTAASYGMLVKQWLREYLFIDSTVPQECIRIRYFRQRGLRDWKLFEIAAMLPLILQVSLALFFAGLCFFTSSVHPSIGGTSIGLVGGWALFFSLAVMAPIFSARCPYKTTFLKEILSVIRPWIRRSIASFTRSILALFSTIQLDDLSYIRLRRGNNRSSPDQLTSPADAATIVHHILARYPLQDGRSFAEEADLRRVDDHDLVILNHVDSTLLDDRALSTMRLVLLRRLHAPENVFRFIVACIRCRISNSLASNGMSVLVGLHTISPATRLCLVDILSDVLHHALTKITVDAWYIDGGVQWMDDALTLIFALIPPFHSIPDRTTLLFRHLLAPSPTDERSYNGCGLLSELVIATACGESTTEDWQASVFTGLSEALKTVHPVIFRDIAHWSYLKDDDLDRDTATFEHILLKVREIHGNNVGSPLDRSLESRVVTMVELAGLILYTQVTTFKVGSQDDIERASPGFTALLQFIMKAIPLIEELFESELTSFDPVNTRIPGGVALDKVFVAFFTSPYLVYSLMESFTRYPRFLSTSSATSLVFMPLLRLDTSTHLQSNAILDVLIGYFDTCNKAEIPLDLILALQLCLIVTSLPSDSDETSRAIYDGVSRCVKNAYDNTSPQTLLDHKQGTASTIAHTILNIMDGSGDGMDQFRIGRPLTSHTPGDEDELNRYARWLAHFDVSKSRFPDELIDILRQLSEDTEDEAGRTFWRIRRLESLEERGMSGLTKRD